MCALYRVLLLWLVVSFSPYALKFSFSDTRWGNVGVVGTKPIDKGIFSIYGVTFFFCI